MCFSSRIEAEDDWVITTCPAGFALEDMARVGLKFNSTETR